eukprot:scaffold6213_cov20-Tisochrysis_lutea.AAC.3
MDGWMDGWINVMNSNGCKVGILMNVKLVGDLLVPWICNDTGPLPSVDLGMASQKHQSVGDLNKWMDGWMGGWVGGWIDVVECNKCTELQWPASCVPFCVAFERLLSRARAQGNQFCLRLPCALALTAASCSHAPTAALCSRTCTTQGEALSHQGGYHRGLGSESRPAEPDKRAEGWLLFNDFAIMPVDRSEVMASYGAQKLPCMVYYSRVCPHTCAHACVYVCVSSACMHVCTHPLQIGKFHVKGDLMCQLEPPTGRS